MKVTREGKFKFKPGGSIQFDGWVIDAEGAAFPPYQNGRSAVGEVSQGQRAVIAAALIHIGATIDIKLDWGDEPAKRPAKPSIEAERLALDAIAMARWEEQ